MALKGVHVIIPRTCEDITLHGKRNFADVIELRTYRWGDYRGLLKWASVITRVLKRWDRETENQRRDMMTEQMLA